MKINFPKVHPAVNVGGLLATLGSGLGLFLVNNAPAVVAALPAKDAMLATLVIGAIATILPQNKHSALQPPLDPQPVEPIGPAEPKS